MKESSQEKAEKEKVLKKLLSKWLTVQETERKATLLIAKNEKPKKPGTARKRKIP